MSEPPVLAIVVPAYKGRFLLEALRSIKIQTCQRFRLYVCDDGSAEDLKTIFCEAGLPETAVFHRFEQNVGSHSVVESWRRAVARTSEQWVWLFSDDDLMHPGCVAAFYEALQQDRDTTINVYRFNTLVINHEGLVTHINPPNPERESAEEFIYHRLVHQRESLAPEHIFRRRAYESRGGFVEFPYALGSDDATWFQLAGKDTPLRGISGPRVYWRLSGDNISSFSSHYVDKLMGLLAYAAWLYDRLEADAFRTVDGYRSTFCGEQLVRQWFINYLKRSPHFFTLKEINLLANRVSNLLGLTRFHVWLVLLKSNAHLVYKLTKTYIR